MLVSTGRSTGWKLRARPAAENHTGATAKPPYKWKSGVGTTPVPDNRGCAGGEGQLRHDSNATTQKFHARDMRAETKQAMEQLAKKIK